MHRLTRIFLLTAVAGLPRGALAQDVGTLQDSCNGGDATACFQIGALYRSGQSVERDPVRATVYLERACSQGSLQGCATLAAMYQRGEGIAPNMRRAVALFEQACEGNELSACASLGMLYTEGAGVPQDFERALEYYQRACAGENLLGCANLGVLYQRGLGVEADSARGIELLGRACTGGLAEACARASGGRWQLNAYEPSADPPRAAVQARTAAGTTALLSISCTPERAEVRVDWSTDFQEGQVPLRATVGPEETGASDWAFDAEVDRHTYLGDARALIATWSRLESQGLYLSLPETSASFALSGLTAVTGALAEVCRW